MICVDNVEKSYLSDFLKLKRKVLNDVSFEVEEGDVFGFLGPNGAGKSTVIKILLSLVQPDAGRVSVFGKPASDPESRCNVGYLPENPYYYDYLSAEELLHFGADLSGFDASCLRERTDHLLNKVGLYERRKSKLRSFSKGMVQRAGIAYALMHDPDLIILDEPMSGLDPFGRKMVGDLIIELKKSGKTVFFSSHILQDVERFADKIAIISQGNICCKGQLDDLVGDTHNLESLFLETISKFDQERDANAQN